MSQASAFDEMSLNISQFVQTVETFLGDLPKMEAFNGVVKFIKDGYMETEDEKRERLLKVRHNFRIDELSFDPISQSSIQFKAVTFLCLA